MMTNLFSSFDPSTTNMMSLNWTSTILILVIIPPLYWYMPQRYNMIMWITTKFLTKELKMTLGPKSKGVLLMFSSMFLFILFNNIMGLLPYVFTSSMHLMFPLSLALPMWVSLTLFGWMNHTKHMLAHLIPESIPMPLIPFKYVLKQPETSLLSVRLVANMVAGHLFMSLLGNSMLNLNMYTSLTLMIIQICLMLFEGAVAIIQAYVFSTLSSLYTSEVTYENK